MYKRNQTGRQQRNQKTGRNQQKPGPFLLDLTNDQFGNALSHVNDNVEKQDNNSNSEIEFNSEPDYNSGNGRTSKKQRKKSFTPSIKNAFRRVTQKQKSLSSERDIEDVIHAVVSRSYDNNYDRTDSKVYPIRDVAIQFPHKAYPCQVLLMSKVINGLISGQHCLLESPTGTGKTLALLCSALAWQMKSDENGANFCPGIIPQAKCTCDSLKQKTKEKTKSTKSPLKKRFKTELQVDDGISTNKFNETISIDDSIDFNNVDINRDMIELNEESSSVGGSKDDSIEIMDQSLISEDDDCKDIKCPSCADETKEGKSQISRIYYGTRTHKQISQVVREFTKTEYRKLPMSILSSRERTCVHPEVSRCSNKNDRCNDMIKRRINQETKKREEKCAFYDKDSIDSNYYSFRMSGEPWDLDDLVDYGKSCGSCPYFGTKYLHRTSRIVFCPYNYLIDPIVRRSMDIKVENSIIILDEAHNIEDICRNAASLTVTLDQIEDIRKHFDDALTNYASIISISVMDALNKYNRMIRDLAEWIFRYGRNIESDFDGVSSFGQKRKEISSREFVQVLSNIGISSQTFKEYENLLKQFDDDNDKETVLDEFKFNTNLVGHLAAIINTIGYLFINNMKYLDDYKVVIEKRSGPSAHYKMKPKFGKKNTATQRFSEVNEMFDEKHHYVFNLWCFNPGVAFNEIKKAAHCVIVASGTLSPLDSFQSELGIHFKHIVEASHVIKPSQIWTGIVTHGPSRIELNSTYNNVENIRYQDEVGRILLDIIQTVPNGVLVFFPSYSLMNKLYKRWENTGLINRMKMYKKAVLQEPNGSGSASEFSYVMEEYFNTIESCPQNGAVLLAVCRGKVSEGIDFADEQARAVVTIGIPFPHLADAQVILKKKYNDGKNSANSNANLLPGSRWYEIQAFRAINQAFGRCIRHLNDWGAIILIDSRLNNPRYKQLLSKWIRNYLKYYQNFDEMHESLKGFIDEKRFNC